MLTTSTTTNINNEPYFEWLCGWVCNRRFPETISYTKLLRCLHETEFIYSIKRDGNRAEDGELLRDRYDGFTDSTLPCSVLEMMIALSIRCEDLMDDTQVGNRTGQWFWNMIVNLRLGGMDDEHFDFEYVCEVIDRFLKREYEPDGRGGLFAVPGSTDMRDVEIWFQLLWYLDYVEWSSMKLEL